ncbi:hypothetical protein GO491_10350 [Flavobacteriaceae bacterium Ap0902]|nr:hypothetical protein [Flavobacteriaceae bacterium Ap0902]
MKNLNELRAKKEELKANIDQGFQSPFSSVLGLLQHYTNGNQSKLAMFDKSEDGRNQLLDEGVKALLTLAASAAVTRFKLGPIPKLLLTTGVAIATPYVVDKIQDLIHEKKNS